MYFPESEAIARKHRDLHGVIEQVDGRLAEIFSAAPLRPADFSSVLGVDVNQIVSTFGLLAGKSVLSEEEMVECERCQNLMPAAAYHQAIDDEDRYQCSGCGRDFRPRARSTTVYRMTATVLKRPKPDVPVGNMELVLGKYAQTENVFKREGHFWIVKFGGDMKLLKEELGAGYIARLLADPNRDFPAVDLWAMAADVDPRIAKGSSGPVFDAQARGEYLNEYRELEDELEIAESNNDLGQKVRAQEKLEAVGKEIARGSGLGGRLRESSEADKARKRVSAALDRAMGNIEKEHKPLGRHLRLFITLGSVLRYTPERETIWLT